MYKQLPGQYFFQFSDMTNDTNGCMTGERYEQMWRTRVNYGENVTSKCANEQLRANVTN